MMTLVRLLIEAILYGYREDARMLFGMVRSKMFAGVR